MQLNSENYRSGLLVDDDLMAGITDDTENPGQFIAFVLRHATGEHLGAWRFNAIDEALAAIHSINRPWKFEKTSGGCGDKGAGGGCGKCECGPKKSGEV
jgi:hypothetical protein